jgi:hypothetical protein
VQIINIQKTLIDMQIIFGPDSEALVKINSAQTAWRHGGQKA